MEQRKKDGLKGDWLKIRCASTFKKHLQTAAKRESRSMANLIIMVMTKYCDEQEAMLNEKAPEYLKPKAVKPHKRRANTHYPHASE